ncbi:MAG: hypothetical protein Q8N08_07100 [Methanobacteriaceae archaeon]|nr:hypothetical protein [Methanobacteriaceae archaeon]
MLKIVIIAIFFSRDVSFVLKELEELFELRKFVKIANIPSNDELSRFMSQFSDEQFINLILMVLNTIYQPRRRKEAWIIVDSTDIQLDLNWFRRKISKKSLEKREFKWG